MDVGIFHFFHHNIKSGCWNDVYSLCTLHNLEQKKDFDMPEKKWLLVFAFMIIAIQLTFISISSPPAYDVVVLGSDPESLAASIAAAREQQRTLLLDTHTQIGGVFTLSKLNTMDMSYAPDRKTLLTRGIFEEFYRLVHRRTSFDIQDAIYAFWCLARKETHLTLNLGARSIILHKKNGRVLQLSYIDSKGTRRLIAARQIIDSTPDATYAEQIGVPFTYGQEDYRGVKEAMCATLVFELRNVDWHQVARHLRNDGNAATGVDAYSAWGYSEMTAYVSSDEHISMRALNLGKQSDGNVLVNGLQIFSVDGTNLASHALARKRAEHELPSIIEYMHRLPGFENAELVSTAPELYIRETRHMKGLYRLSILDVLENHDFEDRIAFGAYPVDIQKSDRRRADQVVGKPRHYAIPFRSIVAPTVSNLLVASRSASYDSLAHGSARTIPTGMAVAEAAGVAAAYANVHHVSFPDMASDPGFYHVHRIQKILNRNHACLYPYRESPVPGGFARRVAWASSGLSGQ
jgi:hypothetical protein